MIYADNAATTKLSFEAYKAMKPFLLEQYGNPSQPYSFSRKSRNAIQEARRIIADCIGASPEEIIFTSGGTESDNWAIKGIALKNNFIGEIITSEIEHHAVLNSCSLIETQGMEITKIGVDGFAEISESELENHIGNKTKLVSLMFANNEVGTIEPIKKLCDVAHKHNVIFHTDAVQALGHFPIDVKNLGVDMLSASAHKCNGPRGIGFLYKKRELDIPSYMSGGSQEYGMRAGTENVASIVAMAQALKMNCSEIENNAKYLIGLESLLFGILNEAKIDYCKNGSNNRIPGNISLSFRGFEGEMLLHRLDLMGICVSTGSACDSKETQISHVLKAMNLSEEYAKGTIRISISKDNTEADIRKIATSIIKIINCKIQ